MKPQIAGFLTGAALAPGFWLLQGVISDTGHAETLVDPQQPSGVARLAGSPVIALPIPAFGALHHQPTNALIAAKDPASPSWTGRQLHIPANAAKLVAAGAGSGLVQDQPNTASPVMRGPGRLVQTGGAASAAVEQTRVAAAVTPGIAAAGLARRAVGQARSEPTEPLAAALPVAAPLTGSPAPVSVKSARSAFRNEIAATPSSKPFFVEDLPLLHGPVITVGVGDAAGPTGLSLVGEISTSSSKGLKSRPVPDRLPVIEYRRSESARPDSAAIAGTAAKTPMRQRDGDRRVAPAASLSTQVSPGPAAAALASVTPLKHRIDLAGQNATTVAPISPPISKDWVGKSSKVSAESEKRPNARPHIPSPLFGSIDSAGSETMSGSPGFAAGTNR